jgi:hypothetical protein
MQKIIDNLSQLLYDCRHRTTLKTFIVALFAPACWLAADCTSPQLNVLAFELYSRSRCSL